MTIEILPARLANQIAAGEVVERPASVIKELIENSLDAGANKIHIDIEKGGVKRIRISDNGKGIVKDELKLALSRHATSKIKNLNDLESINSLGFRGEALASISSVSRLTLTSKPIDQETAWQAFAEGRDMSVTVKPAAHPNGTTIEVNDLFFNTPARRKFLRTEKTEFNHIDEVVRRIALSHFEVNFTLTHNGKIIRQYRAATQKAQFAKRVAMICGQGFIDKAIEVECIHDDLTLWGWVAEPSFYRNQNDLCYSYVNGRMMRDKLINHAIRQAYADLLPQDSYPAFVLYLELDFKEVDVNVHPAKHEVRFHQGRYIHDFIYSVCHKALQQEITVVDESYPAQPDNNMPHGFAQQSNRATAAAYEKPQYIKPLTHIKEQNHSPTYNGGYHQKQTNIKASAQLYQDLVTPYLDKGNTEVKKSAQGDSRIDILHFVEPGFVVIDCRQELRLLSIFQLAQAVYHQQLEQRWNETLVSQPLLLPLVLNLTVEQTDFLTEHEILLNHVGIIFQVKNNHSVQIRQFPAILRHKDVSASVEQLLSELMAEDNQNNEIEQRCSLGIAKLMVKENYTLESANHVLLTAKNCYSSEIEAQLLLNSVVLDLTSAISQLK